MCGIIAYLGQRPATKVLLNGLTRLEYRGYDSAGLAVVYNDKLIYRRSVGRITNLQEQTKDILNLPSTVGLAHTRWATHGLVNLENTHPHISNSGKLILVHNGIIENYLELKKFLGSDYKFYSETDSEVLINLIDYFYQQDLDLKSAVQHALKKVRGTYGLVVLNLDQPQELIGARLGSPLVVGINNQNDQNEYFLASDATPILPYTNKVIYLDDGELVILNPNNLEILNLELQVINKKINELNWTEEQAQKQNFPHFMLKEIYDQPQVLQDAIRGRLRFEEGTAHLGGLNIDANKRQEINKIYLLGCGTAYYAGLSSRLAFERLAGINTEAVIGSEFRYTDPIIDKNTLVFALSQSGETADTLAALREAKQKGALVRGIVNVIGSTIARETDGGTYIHAGPELAVASTKAYLNMLAVLFLYALEFGRSRRLSLATGQRLLTALLELPEKINKILTEQIDNIKKIAYDFSGYKNFLYLGRGINFPVALEGSHKLKEISYIHSEAYPAGEMKHGVNALLSADFPVLAIMTKNQLYSKMYSNIQEVKARQSPLIIIANEGDEEVKELTNNVIYIPKTMELLEPILNIIPLQLFAYYIADKLGRDIDRPRNLAKSVTVE